MAVDEALLEAALRLRQPVLRFYSWTEASATFGYSQKYFEVARWTSLRPLIRRPTGGGLVLHDTDWTYSVTIPPDHGWYGLRAAESYQRVHEWIRASFAKFGLTTNLSACCQKDAPGQCFVGAEKFDLLSEDKKIAGAAQRRNRCGLLIQGSVRAPEASPASRVDWEVAMMETLSSSQEIRWMELQLDYDLNRRISELIREKYAQPVYNEGR